MPTQERNTVYKQYVRNALWGMCVDGVGDFTLEDLAKYAGLKVTGNLRKQCNACVRDGILYYDFSGDKSSKGLHFSFSDHWCKIAETAAEDGE